MNKPGQGRKLAGSVFTAIAAALASATVGQAQTTPSLRGNATTSQRVNSTSGTSGIRAATPSFRNANGLAGIGVYNPGYGYTSAIVGPVTVPNYSRTSVAIPGVGNVTTAYTHPSITNPNLLQYQLTGNGFGPFGPYPSPYSPFGPVASPYGPYPTPYGPYPTPYSPYATPYSPYPNLYASPYPSPYASPYLTPYASPYTQPFSNPYSSYNPYMQTGLPYQNYGAFQPATYDPFGSPYGGLGGGFGPAPYRIAY